MSRRKSTHTLSEQDRSLFRQTVGTVKPMTCDRVLHPTAPRKRIHQSGNAGIKPMGQLIASDWATPVHHDEPVFSGHSGLSQRQKRQLTQGRIPYHGRLDLHGFNSHDAAIAVDGFLGEAIAQQCRCVLIVHGKGYHSGNHYPVIKSQLIRWLDHHTSVIAYSSATPRDGGTGAVYVLLRTNTRQT